MREAILQKIAFRTVSQIGISYRHSPLSKSLEGMPSSAPLAGDRFPWLQLKFHTDGPITDSFETLDDTQFNLIVIGQRPPSAGEFDFGDLLRIHPLPVDPVNDKELAHARIPQPSFYLLRPDGHVGLCGTRLETASVTRYIAENLQLAA